MRLLGSRPLPPTVLGRARLFGSNVPAVNKFFATVAGDGCPGKPKGNWFSAHVAVSAPVRLGGRVDPGRGCGRCGKVTKAKVRLKRSSKMPKPARITVRRSGENASPTRGWTPR